MTTMARAAVLRGFPELVTRLGGDPRALLRKHRLNPGALDNEDALIPSRASIELLEDSARLLQCPDFGLRLAQFQDVSTLGPLAIAIQHARSVREAAASASRFIFIQGADVVFTLQPAPMERDCAELRFEFLEAQSMNCRQCTDLAIGLTHRIISLPFGGSYPLDRVLLPHEPLAPASAYARFFGAPVRFAQAYAALRVPVAFLEAPLPDFNETLRTLAVNYLERNYSDREHSLSARVRLILSKSLGSSQSEIGGVAALLAMHPRTLQRQLAEEESTFESIRDQVRRQAALRYLVSTELALTQIATLLGLSEQSALTRCCRRWFDKTPSEIRNEAATPDEGKRASAR
ncbi:AraC family transcriptional regulator [Dokdonella sp.]|uniref:AraC family transcriptional regulator n=1 Tax=Dokdonella sp. TaxID=2291710 RepID=UPI001B024FB7|nr:AraC family transcriptional regulator [Dokdonella sp.]MBO9663320.1 AraC family transcriptional regulator [Dokdonella sp.]